MAVWLVKKKITKEFTVIINFLSNVGSSNLKSWNIKKDIFFARHRPSAGIGEISLECTARSPNDLGRCPDAALDAILYGKTVHELCKVTCTHNKVYGKKTVADYFHDSNQNIYPELYLKHIILHCLIL